MGGAASILFWCAAPRFRPRAAPARWCGLARRPRPPREQAAGGAGARVVQVQPHPPPPASRSLLGEEGHPLGSGGAEGRSCVPQAGGGERGGGGPPHRPLLPRPVGRRPDIRCLRRAPPGYTRAVGVAGRPRALGAARSAANGSVRPGGLGERGGSPPPWFAPPSSRTPRMPVPRAGVRVWVWAPGAPLPAVRGGPVARGVRGRALSPLRLPSSCGLSGPTAHVLCGVQVRGPL